MASEKLTELLDKCIALCEEEMEHNFNYLDLIVDPNCEDEDSQEIFTKAVEAEKAFLAAMKQLEGAIRREAGDSVHRRWNRSEEE